MGRRQAKMLIISWLKCKETEQTFHVNTIFFLYPFGKPIIYYEEFYCILQQIYGIDASESLNGSVHVAYISKLETSFSASLKLDLGLNCQVLSQVFGHLIFKHKLEKF